MTRLPVPSVLVCLAAVAAMPATADSVCGDPFTNAYGVFGPFDYRTASKDKREIVERYHFTPNVEALRHGNSGTLGAELDYTLRVFPNHPRALNTMVRLGQRDKTQQPKGTHWPVACYVERAIRFTPDDIVVRHISGVYLALQGQHEKAKEEFRFVLEREPNNASAHYNLGLAHFETKHYDAALEEAKLARSLGVTLPGLSTKLKSVGKSVD